MQFRKPILVAAGALAIGAAAASGLAADYPEERGVVPSIIPPAADETGRVNNIPAWRSRPAESAYAAPAVPAYERGSREVGAYFMRYDTNGDGVISLDEARQDPELMNVFARADANHDGVLDPTEFHQAAILAVNDRRNGAAFGSGG